MESVLMQFNDFGLNVCESFKQFREEKILLDVTLISDDGQLIQAHKVVLASGSSFFRDIITKSNHPNLVIYLKGINCKVLENVIDLLYNEEVAVPQQQLKTFLETTKDLQVYGFQDGIDEFNENITEQNKGDQNDSKTLNEEKWIEKIYEEGEVKEVAERLTKDFKQHRTEINNFHQNLNKQENTIEKSTYPSETETYTVVKVNVNISPSDKNKEYESNLEQMVIKKEGIWMCKVCGKTGTTKAYVKIHSEKHIEGISHSCQKCSKIFLSYH